MSNSGWTYERAGVSLERANRLIQRIIPLARKTRIPGVIGGLGGFSGLFDPSRWWTRDSILVASADGVGTKLEIAQQVNHHETVGVDLVAMCVNDLVTTGARPLFFFDYIACGKLSVEITESIIRGIVRGCREAGCALLGGETAEMPEVYGPGKYDLAGFTVGVVERKKLIEGNEAEAGDLIVGLASSGFHSNGFSLIRKLFSRAEIRRYWRKLLLPPTRIYVKTISRLVERVSLKGVAHITGGGFFEKLTRVIPPGLTGCIEIGSWPIPRAFRWIQERGNISTEEMFRIFNMGIGMALVLAPSELKKLGTILQREHLKHWVIGNVARERNRERISLEGAGS